VSEPNALVPTVSNRLTRVHAKESSVRILATFLSVAILGACADRDEVTWDGAAGAIRLVDHWIEVPRNPAPGYHRDGAMVEGAGAAWAAAGVQAGDVITSVDGTETWSASEAETLLGRGTLQGIRVVRSRVGVYGTRLLDLESIL
jgi:hypothetical protein